MKFKVTMKDPDTLHDAIREAVQREVAAMPDLDDDEREVLEEKRIEKVGDIRCEDVRRRPGEVVAVGTPYRTTYQIVVDVHADGSATAFLLSGGEEPAADEPLRGYGESPLQAIRALCETVKQWPISGADAWLSTPKGVELARKFVPGFEPRKPGASS